MKKTGATPLLEKRGRRGMAERGATGGAQAGARTEQGGSDRHTVL